MGTPQSEIKAYKCPIRVDDDREPIPNDQTFALQCGESLVAQVEGCGGNVTSKEVSGPACEVLRVCGEGGELPVRFDGFCVECVVDDHCEAGEECIYAEWVCKLREATPPDLCQLLLPEETDEVSLWEGEYVCSVMAQDWS